MTERIERTLQETPNLDFLRSYTSAGLTTIFVNLKGGTPAGEVPDIWYQVRKNVGDMRHTLPAGVVGPGFNDEFGDTFGIIYGFTADGFTHRELRDYVEDVRSRLLRVPDVSKIEILGAQDEQIFVEFSTERARGARASIAATLIAALQAQNVVSPAGILQTGDEKLSLRVSGAFGSEQDILAINFAANGRLIRLGDIAEVRRGYADPPQPMFRVNGKPAIGARDRHARRRRHPGARPQRAADDGRRSPPICRSASSRSWWPTSPSVVDRDRRVHDLALAGDRDHHGGQLLSLGVRAGADRRALDPADARDRLSDHAVRQHRPAAHFARRADHRARPCWSTTP